VTLHRIRTALEILASPPEPVMPEHARFAIVERPADPFCKPKVYASADDLGRAVHARRKTRPIYMLNAALKVAGEDKPRKGVSLWAINPGDDVAGDYLGWVFIGGLERRELADLLARLDVPSPQVAEAA